MNTELRIGNWVNFTYKHKGEYLSRPCKVIGLDDAGQILVKDKGHTLELRGEAKPVELTPEILEKAGFEKKGEGYRFGTDLYLSSWQDCIWLLTKYSGIDISPEMPLITSLHQLQNLYFALTGTELTVNP